MRTLRIVYLVIIIPVLFSCNVKAEKQDAVTGATSVAIEVYYFHFTRRCATCNAVEEKTVEFLKELYAEQMENKSICFKPINLDEEDSEEIAEKLGVSGQALLFVKGDKMVNLTTNGFMNARSNPDKFKEKIKETVDGLLS